jgi:hypothetical protein
MIHRALLNLCPKAEWDLIDDTIIWKSNSITQPTQEAINAEIERIKTEDITQIQKAEAIKKSALDKLAALGLTQDEVKALVG